MKKRFGTLLTVSMTVSLTLSLTVILCFGMALSVSAIYTIDPASETIRSYKQVYNAIYEAIDAQQSYLDVSQWKIKDYEIMNIFTDVMYNSPEFFYADQKLVYRYNNKGYVTSLSFTYNMSYTKRTECQTFYEQEISYLVQEVEAYAMSDAEKALYVHDALISSYAYDTEETIFDAYNFLKERKGVCQAYALCYMAVMRELDIPCFMVISQEMNHSWNLVQIDGEWYHVDLVFDDPQPDRPGQVLHDHFLLSDAGIAADRGQGTHWGWRSMLMCKDESYAERFWQASDTRLLYLNDRWYYVDDTDGQLYRVFFSGFNRRTVYTFTEHWYVDPAAPGSSADPYWKGLYTGLGLYNGYLYLNTPTAILRIHPITGETMELLHLDDTTMNIYGIDIWANYWKNQMDYLVGDTPDRNTTAYIESIPMRYTEEEAVVENVFLPFSDVSRVSPYYRAVEYLYENHIMNGLSQTAFAPGSTMTRAQFAAILSRLHRYDPTTYNGAILYTDVAPTSWYAPYVDWVTASGYMTATHDGRFEPEGTVSREELYAILASVCRSMECGIETTMQLQTVDRDAVSDWAVSGVDYCYTNGLVPEKYQYALNPMEAVQRGEMADVLYRFCLLANGDTP